MYETVAADFSFLLQRILVDELCLHTNDLLVIFVLQEMRRSGTEITDELEEEYYMSRLDAGLFTLQLVDYIMLDMCHTGPSSVCITSLLFCIMHLQLVDQLILCRIFLALRWMNEKTLHVAINVSVAIFVIHI